MKLIAKYISICLLLTMGFMSSCSNMNDLGNRFLDEGETIYAARVYGITNTGKDRLEVVVIVPSQRVETVRIYWKDYTDSVDVHIGGETGLFSTVIDLPEGDYLFQLISFDKYGNKSLPMELSGTVLGSVYEADLVNRSINDMYIDGTTLKVSWGNLRSGTVEMQVAYTDTDGEKVEALVAPKDNVSEFENYATGFSYRTVYKPDSLCIDLFYADNERVLVQYRKIDKSAITVDGASSTAADSNPANTLDDDIATFWQSGSGGYPHYIIYDLKTRRNIARVDITASAPNSDFTEFRVDGSTNAINWNQQGAPLAFADVATTQKFSLQGGLTSIRYCRLFMLAGVRQETQFAEITIYEQVNEEE